MLLLLRKLYIGQTSQKQKKKEEKNANNKLL